MATIKSYTDIEQSKKLVEILPLESADMYYALSEDESMNMINFGKPQGFFDKTQVAWSLAALISLIPQEIFDGEYIINITEGCDNKWILTYDHYKNKNHSYYSLSISADNLLDACHELILKLNELNLL